MSAPRGLRFWLLTLGAVLGVAVTAALGLWQLSRAGQREALQAAIQARQQMPPLDARALLAGGALGDALHRPVRLRGSWLRGHTVYLENRQMRGQPGFYVLTPLRIEGSQTAVLVQRGWVARDFIDRTRVPEVPTPAGPVELQGRMAPSPAKLYEFRGGETGRIRQNLDLAAFRQETGLPLLDLSVVQTVGPVDDGLLRDWPQAGSGAEKNYGYAFQWFGLSGLIAILYVWFQFIAPRRQARRR